MAQTTRLLLVEDSDADAELMLRELKRSGLAFESRRVETEPDLHRALEEFRPHLVLSDFAMPQFNGFAALRICREHDLDLPFVFISGTVGEDIAVEAVRAGAGDYVMKGSLSRLPTVVQRELREAQGRRRLRFAEYSLRRAQILAKLAFATTGRDGHFETRSDNLATLLRLPPERLPRTAREWLGFLPPGDRERVREAMIRSGKTGTRAQIDYAFLRGDGSWARLRQVIEPLAQGADPTESAYWLSTLQDITEEAHAEEKIRRLNRVYAVLSAINALIVRAHDRDELFREACRIAVEEGRFPMAWVGLVERPSMVLRPVAGSGPYERFVGAARHRLTAAESDDRPTPPALAVAEQRPFVSNDVTVDPRITLKQEHAEIGLRSCALLPLVVGGEVAGVLSLHAGEPGFFDEEEMKLLRELAGDISFALAQIEKDRRLNYLAYYDGLTGLANRTFFLERLSQALHAASQAHHRLGLAIVDVERFKAVNDALGRNAADELLRQVAARLAGVREPDQLARVGPDQFAVLVPDLRQVEALGRLMEERSRAVFGEPFRLGETELRVGAKVGAAVFPEDGADAETLFTNAEAAVKRAKATGVPQLFYTQEMTARVAENLSLESRLRRALENGEFVLHYQPKVDVATRRLAGAEALIRWQSPELGLVPPMKFIPLMEQTGMILEAGAWALAQAVRDRRRWREAGLPAPRIAVNVSAIQLRHRDFVAVLRAAIAAEREAPGIDLELTESSVMGDVEENIGKLESLRALGLQVAIDDFGTGHSSLAYLARLPLDALKIDRSFVIGMLKAREAMTLVQTMISLAHSLRLKVIAEGVEHEEQAKALRRLRCDQMQGYLLGRPIAAEAFAALLKP